MERPLIISNTTPLINFAEIGRMDVLEALFGPITIPPSVVDELAAKAGLFPTAAQVPALPSITLMAPADRLLVSGFAGRVHPGEAECLALAMEHPGSLLLLRVNWPHQTTCCSPAPSAVWCRPDNKASSRRSSLSCKNCAPNHASGFQRPLKIASCVMRVSFEHTHTRM